MNKIKSVSFIAVFVLLFIGTACNKKQPATCDGSTPTYESEIKAIISDNCNSSSCHGSGSKNGDFTTFQGLKPQLDNGKFKSEVIDSQTMPKGGAKLTSSQLAKIVCWKDNGYPEK